MAIAAVFLSINLSAQTNIDLRKNSYTPAQDVQLGRQAAGEVRQQLPLLHDRATSNLVERIGEPARRPDSRRSSASPRSDIRSRS